MNDITRIKCPKTDLKLHFINTYVLFQIPEPNYSQLVSIEQYMYSELILQHGTKHFHTLHSYEIRNVIPFVIYIGNFNT